MRMGQTIDWGRTHYKDAWDRQLTLVDQRRAGECEDTLILTEHEPVYTIGVRPGAEQHLVWTPDILEQQGIDVVKTNRGGDITYHGPGQIVGYPILSLKKKRDLHGYLRDLEEVLIRTVAHFGIEADRREGKTGIWIADRKMAAIGVAVKSWTTYHGFALNVSPDLRHFNGIVPCGISDGTVTSLEQECGNPPLIGMVKSRLILEFWNLFTDLN
jgi:lipoyl(octanoyl) transferase